MGTIVNSLSNFYYDCHNNDVFCIEKAERLFYNCSDKEKRIRYIKEVYETILSSSIINETSKILIRTNKSYAEVARYYNSLHEQKTDNSNKPDKPFHLKTVSLVKADVSYTNRKLKRILCNGLDNMDTIQKDYFSIIIYQPEISTSLWKKADEALEQLKIMLNGRLLAKDSFWLNIPINDYNKDLTEAEFNNLLSLITPYFSSQKSLAQLKLNSMKKETGYLNYILKANMENSLNETDIARRNMLLSLMDKEQVKKFKESLINNQPDNTENTALHNYQKNLQSLKEDSEKEKQIRLEIMAKIGMIYLKSNGGLNEELQNMVNTLKRQYQQLKDSDNNRQEKINRLETEIQNLQDLSENKENDKDNI